MSGGGTMQGLSHGPSWRAWLLRPPSRLLVRHRGGAPEAHMTLLGEKLSQRRPVSLGHGIPVIICHPEAAPHGILDHVEGLLKGITLGNTPGKVWDCNDVAAFVSLLEFEGEVAFDH